MQKRTNDRLKNIICLSILAFWVGVETPASSHEIEVNGLPCNDLCQAWLGYGKHENSNGSATQDFDAVVRPSILHVHRVASEPHSKLRHSKTEAVEVDHTPPDKERPTPDEREAALSTRHVRPRSRGDQKSVPLPVLEPAVPRNVAMMATKAPVSPPSRSSDAHSNAEAAATSDAGVRRVAPVSLVSPTTPDLPTMTDTSASQKEPKRAMPPTSAVAATPAKPLPSQTPRVDTASPLDTVSKSSVNAHAPTTHQATVEGADKPNDRRTLDLGPAMTAPSAAVASLSPSSAEGSSLHNDVKPSGGTHEGVLQTAPTSTGHSLAVTIGQISADPHNTNVHVVVVNVLQHEIKDVDVRCKARDAQGTQVAEASSHIASIAPSDVAFELVLFPSEMKDKDNFVCEADSR